MSLARKGSFNLGKFYDNLSRIQNSLGKSGPRNTANSLTKPSHYRGSEDDKRNSLMNFKKQLHSKGLAKGKIKIDRPYESSKMSQATEYEDRLDKSDNFAMSEQGRDLNEDPYERVKSKLDCWKKAERFDDRSEQLNCREKVPEMSRTATIGYLLGQEKENIENSRTEMHFPTFQEQKTSSQIINHELLSELTRRNDIYYQIHKGLKINSSDSSKGKVQVSLELQNHFRQHTTMRKIINEFKSISGIEVEDLGELYSFLKSGAGKRSRALSPSDEY